MLQKIKTLAKEIGTLSIGLTLAFVIFMGLSIAKGWTEPTQAPPGGNVGAPINIGQIGQWKTGNLMLNTAGAYANGLIVANGNVGIGTLNPANKLAVIGDLGLGDETFHNRGVKIATKGSPSASSGNNLWIMRGNHDDDPWNSIGGSLGFERWTGTNVKTPLLISQSGSVGIGDNNNPSSDLKLDVEGKVGATEYCDQNGQNCKAIGDIGGGDYISGKTYGICIANYNAADQSSDNVIFAQYPAMSAGSGGALNLYSACACPAGFEVTQLFAGASPDNSLSFRGCVKK